jgi:hypothetical protein
MASETMEQWLLDPAPDQRNALQAALDVLAEEARGLQDQIADLSRERDALLYACCVALGYIEANHRRVHGGAAIPPGLAKTCQRLRDAISMAEGGEGAE